MDKLMHDLRYTLRQLRSRPGFTLAAVATLALGIGVNSAVFGLANWIMLRPVAGVSDGGRLVLVEFRNDRGVRLGASYPNLADLRDRITSVAGLAAHHLPGPTAVHAEGQRPRYVQTSFVSHDYFEVLGTQLRLGRPFSLEEEIAATQFPVAVLSHRFWESMFGGDSGVVDATVLVNGLQTRIVGVGPPGFRGTHLLGEADLFLPGTAFYAVLGFPAPSPPPIDNRGASAVFDQLIGRLGTGSTREQVAAQIEAAWTSLVASYPEANAPWETARPTVVRGVGVPVEARGNVRNAVVLIVGVAGLVLLIACANVANLFLFRGVGRREEWAVRKALGARSGRLIQLQLTESVVVSGLAILPAVLLAVWLTTLFHGPILPDLGAVERVELDWRVIGFTACVALMAGVLAGLAPAVVSLRSDPFMHLTAGPMSIAGRGRVRSALAVLQLALSLSLLVVTLMLVATFRNLQNIDVGFDAERVSAFTVRPVWSGYTREGSQALLQEALSRIQSITGVQEAALSSHPPFSYSIGNRVSTEATPTNDSGIAATDAFISPTYFRTMGLRLLAGRTFREDELFRPLTGGPETPAIVSVALARRLFGNREPLGELSSTLLPGPPARVIGMVENSRWASVADEGAGPVVYHPLPSIAADGGTFLVRSAIPLADLRGLVERVIYELAPSVPVFDVALLSAKIEDHLAQERMLSKVMTVFSLLAVVLAAIGLYAVIAFSVAERSRELGIRMAVGARPGQILRMVVRRGAGVGGVGTLAGLAGAVALSRLVANRLFGISPLDPLVYVASAAVLFSLVLVASFLPARAATRVDPMAVLRVE